MPTAAPAASYAGSLGFELASVTTHHPEAELRRLGARHGLGAQGCHQTPAFLS